MNSGAGSIRPRAFAREAAARFGEYLTRALSHRAALAEPKDLAWLLASYARDGLARVEAAGDAHRRSRRCARRSKKRSACASRAQKGARFFHSTLGANAVLRCLLCLGAVGATSRRRRRGASTGGRRYGIFGRRCSQPCFSNCRSLVACNLSALVEVLNWTAAALDSGGPCRLLRTLQRGRGGPLFLRTFPGSVRSPAPQATGGLVHASGSGPLHGRPC